MCEDEDEGDKCRVKGKEVRVEGGGLMDESNGQMDGQIDGQIEGIDRITT